MSGGRGFAKYTLRGVQAHKQRAKMDHRELSSVCLKREGQRSREIMLVNLGPQTKMLQSTNTRSESTM